MMLKPNVSIPVALLPPDIPNITPQGMTPAFAATWQQLHPGLRQVLIQDGLGRGDHSDARALATNRFCSDGIITDWTARAIELMPGGKLGKDMEKSLQAMIATLCIQAKKVPPWADLPIHLRTDLSKQPVPDPLATVEAVPGKQLIRWRTLRPPDLVKGTASEGAPAPATQIREI